VKRAVLAILLFACHAPPSAEHDAGPAEVSSACSKFGAPCMFAPGKLGTCVEAEKPAGTFVCQSQH